MALRWETVVVDSQNAHALAHWWAEALGWQVVGQSDDEMELGNPSGAGPNLLFGDNLDVKTVKNRLHLDLVPDNQEVEVARLIELGARHVDIGQGSTTWVVLADPEGNEFCVLSART